MADGPIHRLIGNPWGRRKEGGDVFERELKAMVEKTLLLSLPIPWSDAHPSTREALISRGLARYDPHAGLHWMPDSSGVLFLTPTGLIVRDVLKAPKEQHG